MQCACAVLSYLVYQAVLNFPRYLMKGTIFEIGY